MNSIETIIQAKEDALLAAHVNQYIDDEAIDEAIEEFVDAVWANEKPYLQGQPVTKFQMIDKACEASEMALDLLIATHTMYDTDMATADLQKHVCEFWLTYLTEFHRSEFAEAA